METNLAALEVEIGQGRTPTVSTGSMDVSTQDSLDLKQTWL